MQSGEEEEWKPVQQKLKRCKKIPTKIAKHVKSKKSTRREEEREVETRRAEPRKMQKLRQSREDAIQRTNNVKGAPIFWPIKAALFLLPRMTKMVKNTY